MKIPVPATGNRSFERVLKAIELDEVVRPAQITKFVAPRSRLNDSSEQCTQQFPPGALQLRDLEGLRALVAYPDFVARVILGHPQFEHDEARVYQFHQPTGSSNFVYGLFVTDSARNLVDFCLENHRRDQRRKVLQPLIRAICTPESIRHRLH